MSEAPIRRLYRVICPEHAQGILLVISDSPEGAASFMQLRLRDQYWVSSVAGNGFYGTYLVCPMADDVGAGIWLSGYDSSDDIEAVLRPTAPDYDKVNPFPLWGPAVSVRLEPPMSARLEGP